VGKQQKFSNTPKKFASGLTIDSQEFTIKPSGPFSVFFLL